MRVTTDCSLVFPFNSRPRLALWKRDGMVPNVDWTLAARMTLSTAPPAYVIQLRTLLSELVTYPFSFIPNGSAIIRREFHSPVYSLTLLYSRSFSVYNCFIIRNLHYSTYNANQIFQDIHYLFYVFSFKCNTFGKAELNIFQITYNVQNVKINRCLCVYACVWQTYIQRVWYTRADTKLRKAVRSMSLFLSYFFAV